MDDRGMSTTSNSNERFRSDGVRILHDPYGTELLLERV